VRWLVFVFLLFLLLSRPALAESIAIIVNKSNPIEDIKIETLAKIYKGEKSRWKNGELIISVNRPPETRIREIFYQLVLKSDPSKTLFKVDTPIPISYVIHKTSRSVKRFTSHVDQSIGYIYLNEVDDTIKLLRVNGIAPTKENISSGKYVLQMSRNFKEISKSEILKEMLK
jgi:phosphate transport system substrate-binding protein